MSLIQNRDQARRLARAIISDVAIYNKDKVELGIKNDNIFEILKEQLAEGREHFESRVAKEHVNLFDLAVVDVLIKRAGKIESSIW